MRISNIGLLFIIAAYLLTLTESAYIPELSTILEKDFLNREVSVFLGPQIEAQI